MRRARELLCVILSLALLMVCTTVSYAKGGEAAKVTINTDKMNYAPGESVNVSVTIATNYNAVAMRWFVLYSKSVFELDGENGNFEVTDDFEAVGGSVTYNMTGAVSYPQGYSSEDYGIALVQWLGGGENLAVFNCPQGLDCFGFTLKVRDDVVEGATGDILIPENSSYYNAALENASDASTYYKADGLVCTFDNAGVVVKSPVAPEMLPVEGTDTVIDNARNIVYGFTNGINSCDDILSCVRAVCDDTTLEIDETEQGCGTGTVIRLVQDGVTVESYTVVILGDANGDAIVDESDIVMIDLYNAMMIAPEETDPMFIGMDCTMDGVVDESDFIIIDLSNAYMGEIDQVNGGIIFY